MSLSNRIALVLAAVIGAFALVNGRVMHSVFFERFLAVEESEAREDLQRVRNALDEELGELVAQCRSFAASDAVERLALEQPSAEVADQLTPRRLAIQGLDLMFVLDPRIEDELLDPMPARKVRFSHLVDPADGGDLELLQFPRAGWNPNHPVLRGAEVEGRTSGIVLTEAGPLLLALSPVVGADGQGPPLGTVVVGRFLSDAVDEVLSAQTQVDFDVWQNDGQSPLPQDVADLAPEVCSSGTLVREHPDGDLLEVYGTYDSIHSRPDLLLRANVRRDTSAAGGVALRFGQVSVLIGAGVMLFCLLLLLRRIVVRPLQELTSHAVRIGAEEDFRAKLGLEREDELGTLSAEFDAMMDKLEQARAALVETARTAGMSEIATGILHNVGNVLNSVNISASMVAQKVEGLSLADLTQLVRVLEEHRDDLGAFVTTDPRGQHLLPFLTALTGQLEEERGRVRREVGSLTEGLEHICDLIKSQQQFAVHSDLVEPLDLAPRLDEALAITDRAGGRDPRLEVVREYEDLPEVPADKHRLLEILVNLLQNARQALAELPDDAPRRLVLRVRREGDRALVEVEDSGPGIAPENLSRVFNLGFTTKPSGHGYGLHTAANAATEMGARLSGHSDGPGTGARFTLDLPLERPLERRAHAAPPHASQP